MRPPWPSCVPSAPPRSSMGVRKAQAKEVRSPTGPILDGRLMVETSQSAYEAGHQARVPLMIGSNSADFVGFISADTKEALFSQFSERKAAIAAYDPSGTTELRTLLTMAGTDRVQA